MKRVMAVLGAVAMLFVAANAFAQAKTDFSGKWTPDAAAQAPAGGGGGGRGGFAAGPMTITQTATELTIERETPNGAQKTTYKLDGSEQTMGTGKAKASWDGAKIKIETTRETPNGAVTSTAVYSIEGGKLSVATTQPGRNGGEPTTRTATYTKG